MMDDFHMEQLLIADSEEDEDIAEMLYHDAIIASALAEGLSMKDAEALAHYGMPHIGNIPRSGRYAWGTGENPYQGLEQFQSTVKKLKAAGMTDVAIAKHLGLRNTAHLKARQSVAHNELYKYRCDLAVKLKAKGMSNVAIAERIYHDKAKENNIRNLLKAAELERKDALSGVMNAIKDEVRDKKYVAIGEGTELYLNTTHSRMESAVEALKDEGYQTINLRIPQYQKNNGDMTIIRVLTDDPRSEKAVYRELYQHPNLVQPCSVHYEPKTDSYYKMEPPRSIDSKRVLIRYAEDAGPNGSKGIDRDGTIEIRRGCPDLDLGRAHYAQVRIAVDGTHYLKGMALYSDNIPDGYDVVFNTNKHRGTPMMGSKDNTVLKPMDNDPYNPFGATIREQDKLNLVQRHYIDKNGKTQLNCLNIVNEEGNWREWSRTISAQMLSKQPPELAKRQLDLTYNKKLQEFKDIMAITNPTLRKIRLEEFGSGCDAAAVHLKAHGFDRQMSQVILPLTSLKDNEVYAPNFKDGEEVVLIRYPHASIAEIPHLVVNNRNKEGKAVLGRPIDGIGINPHVAAHLSGADFDGDTVIVIPNNRHEIRFREYFDELKNFEPKDQYRGYEGMKKMTKKQRGTEMGRVTNLITDMTAQDAPPQDIIPAIKHSMVVIDAYKHGLNWKQSEQDNHIAELIKRYQTQPNGHVGGATTLFSKASSTTYIPHRRYKGYDPETGEHIWENTNQINKIAKYKTVKGPDGKPLKDEHGKEIRIYQKDAEGNQIYKEQERLVRSTQMADTNDAFTLVSKYNKPIEQIYARYANSMKALGNEARKEAAKTPRLKQDANAKAIYANEVKSIMAKLKGALMNKPLERQALILTDAEIKIRKVENQEMSADEEKKLKNRLMNENRYRVGAFKNAIELTDDEMKAMNSGALSDTMARSVFMNMTANYRNSLFMPKAENRLSPAQVAKAERMLRKGASQGDVAAELGISVDTLIDAVDID